MHAGGILHQTVEKIKNTVPIYTLKKVNANGLKCLTHPRSRRKDTVKALSLKVRLQKHEQTCNRSGIEYCYKSRAILPTGWQEKVGTGVGDTEGRDLKIYAGKNINIPKRPSCQ